MLNFLFATFRLGVRNIALHKLRSILTAMGIIFGVKAVIVMVAIGEGAKRDALEQLQQLGARNILVRSVRPPESADASSRTNFIASYGLKRESDLKRLKTLPDVEVVVALRDTEQKVVHHDLRVLANPIGTSPEAFSVINLKLMRGSYFDKLQYDRAEAVCVLGSKAAQQLFPYEDPMGQQVRVGTTGSGTALLTVVGVLEPTGLRAGSEGAAMMNRDLDMDIYFPLTLAEDVFGDTIYKRVAGSREYKRIEVSEIWLKAKRTEDVENLAKTVENLLEIQQRNGPQDMKSTPRLDVEVKAPIQILRAAERTQKTFNTIMVSVASFALLVGGIGIMNIMLATVTERTKEIGIRRALVKRHHIILQFLIETTVISLTGGLIGIGLGIGMAKVLPGMVKVLDSSQNYPTVIAPWSVIGSFVVSGMIGICFGLYPAIKAAYMNPIEALRHE